MNQDRCPGAKGGPGERNDVKSSHGHLENCLFIFQILVLELSFL